MAALQCLRAGRDTDERVGRYLPQAPQKRALWQQRSGDRGHRGRMLASVTCQEGPRMQRKARTVRCSLHGIRIRIRGEKDGPVSLS